MDDIIDEMEKPMFYVASSWRNSVHTAVVVALRSAGKEVYDFKNEESGFHWNEVGVANGYDSYENFMRGMDKPRAQEGFMNDMNAMEKSTHCVLVLPCGRSAHLEAGWFIGQGKPTAIFLTPDPDTQLYVPELMYKMADLVTDNFMDMLAWCGVED